MDTQRVKSFVVKMLEEESSDYQFEGYASTFGNADREGDVMMKDCFAKSIEARQTYPLCYNHDTSKVIGKVDVREDEVGLLAKGQLNLESPLGLEVYQLLKMGALDSFSIGFIMKDYEQNENSQDDWLPSFDIKSADLLEVSIVTVPCNPKATIETVKSAKVEMDASAIAKAVKSALWERDREELLSKLNEV